MKNVNPARESSCYQKVTYTLGGSSNRFHVELGVLRPGVGGRNLTGQQNLCLTLYCRFRIRALLFRIKSLDDSMSVNLA